MTELSKPPEYPSGARHRQFEGADAAPGAPSRRVAFIQILTLPLAIAAAATAISVVAILSKAAVLSH